MGELKWFGTLQGDRNALMGIDVLRKTCNHPDLLQRTTWEGTQSYGDPSRSGKMLVTMKVLGISSPTPE